MMRLVISTCGRLRAIILIKLKGNLAGKHSIRVNKQWRLVFIWSGERGEARDIYLDNHDYR